MKKVVLCVVATVLCAWCAYGQEASHGHAAKASAAKYMTLPVLPACAEIAAQEGDPMKEAAVILIKTKSGCVIPWHWHTASEKLYFVSGKAKVEMKDHGTEEATAGDYVSLESKGVHQFTCTSACFFFNVTGGAFDIHYVKPDGSEIPPEEALKGKQAKVPVK